MFTYETLDEISHNLGGLEGITITLGPKQGVRILLDEKEGPTLIAAVGFETEEAAKEFAMLVMSRTVAAFIPEEHRERLKAAAEKVTGG